MKKTPPVNAASGFVITLSALYEVPEESRVIYHPSLVGSITGAVVVEFVRLVTEAVQDGSYLSAAAR